MDEIRRRIPKISDIPVEVLLSTRQLLKPSAKGAAIYMDEDVMFKAIEKQAKDGY